MGQSHTLFDSRRIIMAKKLAKLAKVNESFTVNRYDNGFMIEVGGRDSDSEWKTAKVMCSTEAELFEVIKEALAMEVDT
jgi:hypothetical protein